jgi:DNA-binding SARP family transcriptional activator
MDSVVVNSTGHHDRDRALTVGTRRRNAIEEDRRQFGEFAAKVARCVEAGQIDTTDARPDEQVSVYVIEINSATRVDEVAGVVPGSVEDLVVPQTSRFDTGVNIDEGLGPIHQNAVGAGSLHPTVCGLEAILMVDRDQRHSDTEHSTKICRTCSRLHSDDGREPVARVEVLGVTRVVKPDGTTVAIGREPSRRVLAHLAAVAPRAASQAALIEAAWIDKPRSAPESALRMMITRLRRGLGHTTADPAIAHGEDGYRLTSHVAIGRLVFEDYVGQADQLAPDKQSTILQSAVELWRGPPFDGFDDDVFLNVARPLEARYLDALAALQQRLILEGQAETGLARIDAHRETDPFDERFALLAMHSYYAIGDQVRALSVYDQLRRDLRD